VVDAPRPTVGRGEVRVRVLASTGRHRLFRGRKLCNAAPNLSQPRRNVSPGKSVSNY
jgi:hypothetical protein